MKKLITLGIAVLVSAPVMAQKASDISRLTKQKEKTLATLETTANHFGQDMTGKFTCFPDYQAPFETLKAAVDAKIEAAKVATETTFNLLIDGAQNNGLKALVQDLEKYKELKRKEKNRFRKKSLAKIIAQKKQQIQDMALLLVKDSSESYKQLLRDTITLDGQTKISMRATDSNVSVINIFKEVESVTVADGRSVTDIYNQELEGLLNSCQTASCVYLVSGDVKQWVKDSLKLNKKIKLVAKQSIEALDSFSQRKIFKKIDELASEVSRKKPIGDVSDDCIPTPQPVPSDDQGNGDGQTDDQTNDQNDGQGTDSEN